MSKQRQTKSKQERQKALWLHVYNEIDQLVRIFECWPTNQTWANARVESIAIHVRVLSEFFALDVPSRADTMHASEFGFTQQHLNHNESLQVRANKDIAHLTWERLERYEKGKSDWNEQELILLYEICEAFAQHCQKTDDRWDDLANRLSQRLKVMM